MLSIPTYRSAVVSGFSFEDLVDQAQGASDDAKDWVQDQAAASGADITDQINEAAREAAKAHAETLVDRGGEKVDSTWKKAKPWVIGAAVVAGIGTVAVVATALKK